mmetsp:Transcript_7500/g.13619  ORF Transcript_7500/g.13619 Transcript_7500/m.13619 type:complete len:93 (+) Transcript_7500:640-918(+)
MRAGTGPTLGVLLVIWRALLTDASHLRASLEHKTFNGFHYRSGGSCMTLTCETSDDCCRSEFMFFRCVKNPRDKANSGEVNPKVCLLLGMSS